MNKNWSRDPLGVGGKWKYQNVRISMGISEELKIFQKYQFLPNFWWFSWFFLFITTYLRNEKSKKIMKFQKIYRNPSFGVSIGLNHLVSKNMSLSGHFGTITTHVTRFFTKIWNFEWAVQISSKCRKSECNSTKSAECLKSFREKLKAIGNNLFLPFNSKSDVDYGITQQP